MRPIRTENSNFTFCGPDPTVADLPCEVDQAEHVVWSVFDLTDEERQTLADGGQVKLGIFSWPIPPVALKVVKEEHAAGELEDGVPVKPDYRCENCQALYVSRRAEELGFNCGQCGGGLKLPESAWR